MVLARHEVLASLGVSQRISQCDDRVLNLARRAISSSDHGLYPRRRKIVSLLLVAPQAKGLLPKRGSAGRFASKFSGRRADLMEAEIARTIQNCLAQGWNCLWSYSNSGVASINGTLERLEGYAKSADVFCMGHSYKAQGKRGQKRVVEYAIHLCPYG
jgi:hypothetical protein